jgi:hypothetical protein
VLLHAPRAPFWCRPRPLLAVLWLGGATSVGCAPASTEVPDADAVRATPDLGPPPEGDDLGELLTDVAHLVDSSRANHAALENDAALSDWSRAWSLLGRHHIERLRVVDPLAALQIEYGFGRLRQALEDTRGHRAALQRSKELAAQLVALLDAHRGALTAIAPSAPEPAAPPAP